MTATPAAKTMSLAAAMTALALALPSATLAAGTDDGAEPTPTETTTTCTDGKIWNAEKKECLDPEPMEGEKPAAAEGTDPQMQARFSDDQLFEAAREFAYAGQPEHAIRALKAARNQDDPRILNYLGFAHRKAGRLELAMDYYRKALAIDADYLLARSYMGQGLIEMGDIDGARGQLVEIRDRGGKDSHAYRALAESLDRGSTY